MASPAVAIKRKGVLLPLRADSPLGRAVAQFMRGAGGRPGPTHRRGDLRNSPTLARFVKKCSPRRPRGGRLTAVVGDASRLLTAACSNEGFAQLTLFSASGTVDKTSCKTEADTMLQLYQLGYEVQCAELMEATSKHIIDLCSTDFLANFDAAGQLTVL